jgi:hypothetical protein
MNSVVEIVYVGVGITASYISSIIFGGGMKE